MDRVLEPFLGVPSLATNQEPHNHTPPVSSKAAIHPEKLLAMPALMLTGRSSALTPGLSSAAPRRLPASMIKHKAVKLMTHRRPKKVLYVVPLCL